MQSGRERTGPIPQRPTGLQGEVSMASEILVNGLTPNCQRHSTGQQGTIGDRFKKNHPEGPTEPNPGQVWFLELEDITLKTDSPPAWSAVRLQALTWPAGS